MSEHDDCTCTWDDVGGAEGIVKYDRHCPRHGDDVEVMSPEAWAEAERIARRGASPRYEVRSTIGVLRVGPGNVGPLYVLEDENGVVAYGLRDGLERIAGTLNSIGEHTSSIRAHLVGGGRQEPSYRVEVFPVDEDMSDPETFERYRHADVVLHGSLSIVVDMGGPEYMVRKNRWGRAPVYVDHETAERIRAGDYTSLGGPDTREETT